MRLTWMILATVAATGCNTEEGGGPEETAVVGFCADGETPSSSGAALLARAPTSFRTECLNGVYENRGVVQGGDFYSNEYVSRMELRDGFALAAIRCTFEGPASNPPGEWEARDVMATVSVPLAVHDWGLEFLESANDTAQDPFYVSSCETSLTAVRWPFCVSSPGPVYASPPDGETTCVHIDNQGLQLITQTTSGSSNFPIARKIGD